jgi:D-amino-acid dehydrogenase
MAHIAIIGAGITGVTTADALLSRGYRVTVLDKHRYPAMETSFANGGQLSASNAEVWNSTATVIKGLRWMLDRNAPLLVNPSPSWHKYSWMAAFVRNIPNYRQNTIATTRLAIDARQQLFDIAARENIDFDLERRGILHIYHDKKGFEAGLAVNALLKEGGLERITVTPSEIREIEPTLRGDYYGGFFTPSDSTGDIHKFTRGLAESCVRRGARFIHDADVASIEAGVSGTIIKWFIGSSDSHVKPLPGSEQVERFDAVIVCAGVASRAIAASLGDNVNIYPVKGYSITVHLNDEKSQASAPNVSLLDEAAKIVTSRLGADRLRVAGTVEFNGFNRDIRADRISPLLDWTRRNFDGIETSNAVPWSGLRPMMPTMLPHVANGKRPGVFYNTGHGHLGWTLCAATAQMVADLVDTAKLPSDIPLAPLATPANDAGSSTVESKRTAGTQA